MVMAELAIESNSLNVGLDIVESKITRRIKEGISYSTTELKERFQELSGKTIASSSGKSPLPIHFDLNASFLH